MLDNNSIRSKQSPEQSAFHKLGRESLIPVPFDDLSECNGLMNGLDSYPYSLAHLRLWNYYHESTLDTCEPVSLIAQFCDPTTRVSPVLTGG